MDVRRPFFQNIALILAGVLFLNPIVATAAQLAVDSAAGGNTSLGQAGNGVPIVNIATPNGSGLSHNKFSDYNVGQQGLILNNATERLQGTQQGGIILGNPNLNGRAAGVILNEVTGSNRSQLQGYTEVAGQAARVIVANPHGISCDGCGFLNTPRATLSTGTPVIDNGQLRSFDVNGGDIAIEGAGLNASNLDQFDLITRSAKLNAELHAQRLNVITGRNEVDAATLQATAKAADGSEAPLLAIDSSALGGMYAGAIRLVGTEAGVGVKLAGDLAASAGDIHIEANGQLTVANAAASGQIAVLAGQVETQGQVYAGTRLDVQARGDLMNHGSLAARDAVALDSGVNLDNRGHIEAGVNPDDSRNATGDIQLSGQSVRNAGSALASRDLRVNASGALDNQKGQLLAQGDARLDTASLENAEGRLVAGGRLDIASGQIVNAQGLIASGGAMEVKASGLDQRQGKLTSQASLSLDLAGGTLDNRAGLIAANGDLNLAVDAIDNRDGEVSSQARTSLDARRLDNSDSGRLLGARLNLTAERLLNRNQGLIYGWDSAQVTGAFLDNRGGSVASDNLLGIELAARAGDVEGAGHLLNDGGLIASEDRLSLIAAALDNRLGRIEGQGATSVSSGVLDNDRGQLIGLDRLDLVAGQVSNRAGRIAASGPLVLRATGLDQQGGELFSQASLSLDLAGGDLNNDGGLLNAPGTLLLSNLGTVSNRGGEISSNESFTLAASRLDNDGGRLLSEKGLGLRIQQLLSNLAGLVSANGLDLAAGQLENGEGRVSSRGDLVAGIDTLNQIEGELLAAGSLKLTGETLDNRSGLIAANGDLNLAVGEIDNRGGELSSQGRVSLDTQRLDNSDSGRLLGAHLNLIAERLLNRNQGLVYGWDSAQVTGAHLDNRGGTVSSDSLLAIELAARAGDAENDGRLLNDGGLFSSEGTLTLDAETLNNAGGSLSSAGTLSASARGQLFNQNGRILTDADLLLRSAGLDNRGGLISAAAALALATGAFDNDAGRLTSSAGLDLKAGQIGNAAGRIAAGGALVIEATGLNQQGGELFSQSSLALDLQGGVLNNDAGFFNAPGSLLLENISRISNRGGEISSAAGFSLITERLDNTGGKLLSEQDLSLVLSGKLDNQGGSLAARHLDLAAADVDNSEDGLIRARGNLDARVGQFSQHRGQTLAEGTLTLEGASLDNREGRLAANGDVTLKVAAMDNRTGEISTGTSLRSVGQYLDNSDGGRLLAAHLSVTAERLLNRAQGLILGSASNRLIGAQLDNSGGTLASDEELTVSLTAIPGQADADGRLLNVGGLLGSEGTLSVTAGAIDNSRGRFSSADTLSVTATGRLNNQDGRLLTDADLLLRSTGLGNVGGQISATGTLEVATGDLDNSRGQLIGNAGLELSAGQVDNQAGRIASAGALTAQLGGLRQQGGELFSQSRLSLDLAGGELVNDGGLIHAPGALSLSRLGALSNVGGEISSVAGFTLAATSLDNTQGRLLSNGDLTLRIEYLLNNLAGLVSAATTQLEATRLDNEGGTVSARRDLSVAITGALDNSAQGLIQAGEGLILDSGELDNRGGYLLAGSGLGVNVARNLDNSASGLINSQGGLSLGAGHLDSSGQGEVSAKGDMNLALGGLTQHQGALIGEASVTLDLLGGTLDNQAGLIGASGPLSLKNLGKLDNRGGELTSLGVLELAAASLDNRQGRIIAQDWLRLVAGSTNNQNGLLSGWQGLVLGGTALDNRLAGTLSSRHGDVDVQLAGDLLNSGEGAIVAQGRLDLGAGSLDNSGQGILSSGSGQRLLISDALNNAGGQIDAGGRLDLEAGSLSNRAGILQASGALNIESHNLDNGGGRIGAAGITSVSLGGRLDNAQGQLASGGALTISAGDVDNQGGILASQGTATLAVASLDNSAAGTLAANGRLGVTASGTVSNDQDGLIYSRDAGATLIVGRLSNQGGSVESRDSLEIKATQDLLNRGGTLQSRAGDLDLAAVNLDNRQGTIASLEGWVRTRLGGWLRNGAAEQGGLIQARHLDLRVSGSLFNTDGGINALGGDASLTAEAFDNQGGLLTAQGNLLLAGGGLDNRGGRIGAAQITLNQGDGGLDNRQGLVESRGTLDVQGASVDNQGGQLRALGASGSTFFSLGGQLDNRNGVIESANLHLTLGIGGLANDNGRILHAGSGTFGLSLSSAANAGGSLVTQGGLTIEADSWSNSSVLQAGHLTVNVGTFSQSASGQLLASQSFSGSGGNWTNHGLIASDGNLSLTLTGAYDGNGRLTSLGDLSLTAASLSLTEVASISAGGQGAFTLGGSLVNLGRLSAAGDLIVSAGSLSNHGTLGSAQRLTLSTTGLLNENGLLFSGDDMALYVETFTNRYADVYSLGTLLVARDESGNRATRLENISGTLESGEDLSIDATQIINRKDVFEVSERLVSGYITYQCIDCKNRHFDLYYFLNEEVERTVSQDSPSSLIQAGRDLKLVGGEIENAHSVLSAARNVAITGDRVSNVGSATESVTRFQQYRNPFDSESRGVFEGLVRAGGAVYEYNKYNSLYEHVYTVQEYVDRNQYVTRYLAPGNQITQKTNAYYDPERNYPIPAIFDSYRLVDSREIVTANGAAANAIIQAGGDVSINSSNLIENGVRRNGQSIALGTTRVDGTSASGTGTTIVQLNAQLPPDLAQQQVNPLTLPGFSLPMGQNGLFRLSGQGGSDSQVRDANSSQGWSLSDVSLDLTQREAAGTGTQVGTVHLGELQAGGAQLQAGDREQASGLPGQSGGLQLGAQPSSSVTDGLQTVGLPDARAAGVQVPGIDLENNVSHAQGTVVTQASQPHRYLIETNPALTELNRFLSSDYMLDQLGYDPDQAQKRLGDGLYEQRLIREAIVARTGQRFIAGLDSDEAMFRYLMDNAIASQSALNLGLGVSLSAEQVAALTHDIVWMEEQEVLGETVLVPVLYLAQAEGRLAPNGALIQGRDVALISGGDLDNQGTLRASGTLDVQAVNIANSGLLQANERLQLLAEDSIRNAQGGIIAGREVSLTAGNDILNERSVTEHAARLGASLWGQTYLDSAARIEASGSLSLAAGRDVSNLGGVLDSRGDLTIEAGRDVTIASVQDVQHQSRGNWFLNERVSQLGAEVSAGRDLEISAGRDLGIVASQLSAGRDLDLGAGHDLTISSAADESHFLSRSKKVTQSNDRVTQQSSEIQAGRDLSLGAGNDLSVIASRVQAGNDVDIDAGQDINILSAQDESASYYFKKSKGSFGRSKSQQSESYDSTNIASVIEAGNDLSLNTSTTADGGLSLDGGRDVTVIGSRLAAGNDLTLGATGDIAVLSGVEEHGAYSKKTKSGFLGLSKSGKSQLKTTATQVGSELEAGNDVVLAAGNDIRLRASETTAGNDVELRAGLISDTGDINLVAANDEAYSRSESYKKKVGLSFGNAAVLATGSPGWGSDIAIASAKKRGQEAISSTNVGSQVNAERDASLIAERDINVVGSGVSAGRNVLLDAGRDVNVVAGSSSEQVTSWKNTKTLGLQQSADRNGFTTFVGAETLKDKTRTSEQTAAASQISAGLDLDVRAGRDILQQGSDLSAGYDLNMQAGRDILIDAANEQSTYAREQSQKRTGSSTTVNHNLGRTKDAISGAGKGDNTVSQASSTLKAMDAVSQFLAGPTFDAHLGSTSQSQSVSQTVLGNRASTLEAGNDINLVAGNDVLVHGGQFQTGRDITVTGRDIVLDVARGEQRYESQQSQGKGGFVVGTSGGFKVGIGGSKGVAGEEGSQGTASGSWLNAQRDVNLNASNDMSLIGTEVQAGRDIDLKAGNDLSIRAAQNASASESNRRSGGGEVGLTFGSEGVGVYVSVNVGKGDLEREGQRQQEAYLYAGDRLNFSSGRDTAVTGAQLHADEVTGDVGRNLIVASLTDTGEVKGKEFDVSATATFGPGAGFSASVGYGETKGSTEWVENQTRIVARDRLDIRTEEHTQLDGTLLASNTGNLKLDTGTLGFSDIAGHDKEHSYYLNVGGSYGKNGAKDTQQDKSQEGKGEKGKTGWSVEGYEYEKDRQQIVRATVGEGELIVRDDAQTGQDSTEGLNRDVSKAYEITRDDEERTDLYVTKSSVEAVANPGKTFERWVKAAENYGDSSEEALTFAIQLFAAATAVMDGRSVDDIQYQQRLIDATRRANLTVRKLEKGTEGQRKDSAKLLFSWVTQGADTEQARAVAASIERLAVENPEAAIRALVLLNAFNKPSDGSQSFLALPLLGGLSATEVLGGALLTTAALPATQENMKKVAGSVFESVQGSDSDLELQLRLYAELLPLVLGTTLPIHTLDPRFGTLVNPGADSLNTENASSGGYNAGGSVVTVPHTGGNQLDGQQGSGSYTTPVHQLSPGNMYSEEGAKATAVLEHFGNRTVEDLASAAANPINKEGLTQAARALTKHASGQRTTGTFPKLSGGIKQQNETAQQIVSEILSNPKSTYTSLGRGGLEVRAPDGRGLRYNSDGSFSGFVD
ncbi:hemagglutinin repeat-containing protein [Phytopseudomonas dryadis]|nr:hemagglutinin repeat-containing protein [Pseudomonas dryadis]